LAPRIYFIVSCARSGSTSLARILDTATNGRCLMEPAPNLNVESRDLIEGRLAEPRRVLAEHVVPRVAGILDQGLTYGEKNVTLGAFIPYLHEMLRCRFVFLRRDGRDVVTSLMNWHNEAFGSIYRECREEGELSETARKAVAALPVVEDTSDYSRPRPAPGDPFHEEWAGMTRFEMVSWYWSFINTLHLDHLSRIPAVDWTSIDYTAVRAADVGRLFEFLGLEGFDEARTEEMLRARINSVRDRFGLEPRFPPWAGWDEQRRRRFDRIAAPVMRRLGYYS
jgi:hypothetical protein